MSIIAIMIPIAISLGDPSAALILLARVILPARSWRVDIRQSCLMRPDCRRDVASKL